MEIPNGVKCIGNSAFHGAKVTHVKIPPSVAEISSSAFHDCVELAAVEFSEGLELIRYQAFSGCAKLAELIFPEGLKEIEYEAFTGCSSLKHISMPESLAAIGRQVFEQCGSLKEITIPAGIKRMEAGIFGGCSNLEHIYIAEGKSIFREENGLILTKDGRRLLVCPCGRKGTVKIPAGVKRVAERAFYGCKQVTRVEFPEGLTSIGNSAFEHCEKIEEVVLPESMTAMTGYYNFSNCTSLTRLVLPRNMTEISAYAFYQCTHLAQIDLPETMQNVPSHAFSGCSLQQVTFMGKELKLGEEALGTGNFMFITPNMAITDVSAAYRLHAAKCFVLRYQKDEVFHEEVLEQNLKYIKSQRRRLWKEPLLLWLLIQKKYITQKEMTKWIDEAASLENGELSAMLLDYRSQNFTPEELEREKEREWNKQLKWLQTGELPLSEIKKTWAFCKITEDKLAITGYRGEETEVIVPSEIKQKRVVIIDCGAFSPYRMNAHLKKVRTQLQSVVISDGVEEIRRDAFDQCINLKKIELPPSLCYIGNCAFNECTSLQEIILPNSVVQIETAAFSNCTSLQEIILPDKLQCISEYLFWNCTNLSDLFIPKSVTSIGSNSFRDCPKLKIHVAKGSYAQQYFKEHNRDSWDNRKYKVVVEAFE